MINLEQISKKLPSVAIRKLAAQYKFTSRVGGKITPMNFIISFFLSIQNSKHNFFSWADQLSYLLKDTISYNAVKKAQNQCRALFAKALLEQVLSEQEKQVGETKKHLFKSSLLNFFNRVFIEDSTCIKLPAYLHYFFPGSYSCKGKVATAKIQLRKELKSGVYQHLSLHHYRNNDQSFAAHILKTLQAGDLVIRDLGYAVLDVFEKISKLNAFFISRFRYGINIYDPSNGKQIKLETLLRKATRNGQSYIRLKVLAGQKAQLSTTIVAIKCPAQVTRKKRKTARNNRSAKANHSKDYMERLGWTIMITNVPAEVLTEQQLLEVYAYRWRIEIIFKCWKSHLNLKQLFNTKTKLNQHQIQIAFYLFLVWITLFFMQLYNHYLNKVYQKHQKFLSVLKFAKFVNEHLTELLQNPDTNFLINRLAYFCTYKKRYDGKLNFFEQLFLII